MTTPDELILNVLPSPDADTDYGLDAALEHAPPSAVGPLPASKDWSADWWPVANQGSTGACVGYAGASARRRRRFAQAGRRGRDERLSVRFIWMASKETDDLIERPTTFVD